MLLGVDVGGTFTDAALLDGTRILTAKVPTTPEDESAGVLAAVAAVLANAGAGAGAVTRFAHGMTVATNALLEGRSARTAHILTAGFTDLVELARQNRPHLYRLCDRGPAPLVGPALRFAAQERMGPDGVVDPLTNAGALAAAIAEADVEAVAVTLLHAYRHPAHEQHLGAALTGAAPGVSVHLSSALVGTFREYERAATTELDAALSPLLAGYLRALRRRCERAGLPTPAIMTSSGGLIDLEQAAGHAALTVLSGPAGGAAGAAFAAAAAGLERALAFDMGGTSCDVCVIEDGRVAERSDGEIAGRPVALPSLAIHTVGAGGGSIAWADAGALRVGPRSAGALPGPAAYGRGGREPTVTDANLVLGLLDPGTLLAGGIRLDLAAARAAVDPLARTLGLSIEACAEGIRQVAAAAMAGALRVITVDRGVDPRRFPLVCFGGAGGLHATDVADALGIDRVLVPGAAGVLAALGLIVAPERHDAQRSLVVDLAAVPLGEEIARLVRKVADRLPGARAHFEVTLELRYAGQSFELPVRGTPDITPAQARAAFEAEHLARYGYSDPEGPVELVTLRVTGFGETPQVSLAGGPVREIVGPRIVPLAETTVLVPGGWHGTLDDRGTVRLERD
jgi:N-methylhydantoinase A